MVVLDEGGDAVAQVGALVGGPVPVVVECPPGGGDRGVELVGARARQVGETLPGDGRDDGRRLPPRVGVGTGDP